MNTLPTIIFLVLLVFAFSRMLDAARRSQTQRKSFAGQAKFAAVEIAMFAGALVVLLIVIRALSGQSVG